MKEIAIITGGDSAEYEISIQSANVVLKNLDSEKYAGTIVHIKDGEWTAIKNGSHYKINKEDFSVIINSERKYFDFVFMALHGPPAENGKIQPYFDDLKIKYSSCSSEVSALTFNKIKCNKIITELGFNCAKSLHHKKGDSINTDQITKTLGLPCFIKPNQAGSSFGISKVNNEDEIKEAINNALIHDDIVLMEQFIDGVELSCGVTIQEGKVKAFPITEIISQNDFFDYTAKYEGLSEEITPARISKKHTKEVQQTSEQIYQQMNLRGICRIDFIIMNDIPYIIEINTIPGLSEESIIPKQAKEAGISLLQLFDSCIENTLNK
jgi:D-alanine-D-alanine ligase